MKITPNDISSISEFGMLHGSPVKLIKTKGGLHLAVAKLKNKSGEETIAFGSHPAIVRHNIQKQYNDFQPAMMKSEGLSDPVVQSHSHFLSNDLRKSGHDIYSIEDSGLTTFEVTKHNIKVATIKSRNEGNSIVLENLTDLPKEFSRALAGAVCEKAIEQRSNKIKIERK